MFKGNYINGQFVKTSKSDEEWSIHSPADIKDHVLDVSTDYDHVELACVSAQKAYKEWSHTSFEKRKELLLKLKGLFEKNKERMAELISRETGKPLWEANTEAGALAAKISVTLDHSMKLVEESRVENALPNIDGVIRYKSRGAMAVIGPFNFPAHLPNGHIVPALATGNTVVFKPSDKTPGVGQLMAEMIHEAGFPAGVFNLVQGKGEIGKRLVANEHIEGILFTGSYDVGLKIKQETLTHHWKILALEMGGKNTTVVWEDAQLDKAVYETLIGSFLTSGQRCSCTSKIVLHSTIYDEFLERFRKATEKIKVGHWKDSPFMGPLISSDSVDKYLRFQEIATREGAECLLRGDSLSPGYDGHYVSPSIYLVDKVNSNSVYQKSEIFGPNVSVYKVEEYEQAMEINNAGGFGLVMALFTQDEKIFKKALIDAKVGLLNWNRTTNGASSRLPFGGLRKSGNDRPSGHFAVQYTTSPVASLEDPTSFDASKILPGLEL